MTGGAPERVTRALDRLLGWCAGLLPPGRRGWAEAVRAEAGEVPAGMARLGWLAGGLWLVAREAGMVRRIGYWLGVAAVAVAAALAVRYLWSGAHAARDAWWDKARMLLLIALLAGLPWIARRRGVFGPAGRSVTARAVRVGGSAALVGLMLDLARIEQFRGPGGLSVWISPPGPWTWAKEGTVLVLIAACLATVLKVTARRPQARPAPVAWCTTAAGLVLFFTVAPVQVLITSYAAGILAATSRRSPVTPATLAISTGVGTLGGLLMVGLWNPLQPGPDSSTAPRPVTLFMLLVGLTAAATAAVAWVAERRARGTEDPLAHRRTRMWQCLAAGPLTAASAALMLPLLRASPAVHFAAACPAAQRFYCTSAPAVWMFLLAIGPVLGLAIGSVTAALPPRQPPPRPPGEPRPDGTRSGGIFVKT
ncbi:MAG: hypothetical protein ACLQDY_28290 [Streptosporangiaceae bacterium]